MRMRTLPLLALAASASLSPAPAQPPDAEWWVVAHVKARRIAIDPAGDGAWRQLPDPGPPAGDLSPDGSKVVFLGSPNEGGGFAFYVADVTDETPHRKKNIRRITQIEPDLLGGGWMPDNRHFVYQVNDGTTSSIHIIDATAADPRPRPISGRGEHARDPRPAPDASGRVAYRTVTRMAKPYPGDLIIADTRTGDRRTLLRNSGISTLQWSPDAAHIACGVDGSLIIINVADGSKRTLTCRQIDDRFHAHYVPALAWRPDGREIALRIVFAGGVALDPNAPPPPRPFWAGRIYLVPIGDAGPDAAAATSVRSPDHVFELSWIPAAETAAGEPLRPR